MVKLNMPLTVGIPLMVNTPPANEPLTPAGNAPAVTDAPVPPPPIVYEILVIQWAEEEPVHP